MERGMVHGFREFRERMRDLLTTENKVPEERDQKRYLSEAAARTALERCLDHFELEPSFSCDH